MKSATPLDNVRARREMRENHGPRLTDQRKSGEITGRSSALERRLSPLPEQSDSWSAKSLRSDTKAGRVGGRSVLGGAKSAPDPSQPQPQRGVKPSAQRPQQQLSSFGRGACGVAPYRPPPSRAALGTSAPSTGPAENKKANAWGRMRELRILRFSSQRNNTVDSASSVGNKEAGIPSSDEQAQFENAITLLNTMIEVSEKNEDSRSWVTRFTEGKAEARLSKEQLFPVWIIVYSDSLMVIDLNGTAQHRNYSVCLAAQTAAFPPSGCVVFSLLDALKAGEVRLPSCASDVAAMMIPAATQIQWGSPIAALFLNPQERLSILREIYQVFLPSFLQEAYPNGVRLSGFWAATAPGESNKQTPHILKIAKSVQEAVIASMVNIGLSSATAFVCDGRRVGDAPRSRDLPAAESLPLTDSTSASGNGNGSATRRESEQGTQQSQVSCDSWKKYKRGVSSPWEGKGAHQLFTAQLFTSGGASLRVAPRAACHAILVLTPRGPLELVAALPSDRVTVKDVKTSLLRSGLGRSMRLQPDAIRFIYAPGTPVIDENVVIDTKYAVMRLQTRR